MITRVPEIIADFYKVCHYQQYPEGTELVYSNWTARGSRMEDVDKVVFFGLQGFIKTWLLDVFKEYFFDRPEDKAVYDYQHYIYYTLYNPGGVCEHTPGDVLTVPADHIRKLHQYGRLPITIKALDEGTLVPLRVPMFTIENSGGKDFFWVTNFLETLMSSEIWQACTSATIAYQYKKVMLEAAEETCDDNTHVQFQGHDFSMRGMSGAHAASISGAAHLLSFVGTDTIPAVIWLEDNYLANVATELVGTSIPATEHSVTCSNGKDEYSSIKRLITEVYPKGFVSNVSDTWDFWHLVTVVYPSLKNEIMGRDGRVVIRPDSGDPVKIICGDPDAYTVHEIKGLIECLWDTFGGTVNSKGYKVLDTHIGAIYGDSITLDRAKEILQLLKAKGFASSNIVFGIGSFTYQHNTRDTFYFALKTTYVEVNGEERLIQKSPKTDNGTKNSALGKLIVVKDGNTLRLIDGMNQSQYENMINIREDQLKPVFVDGVLVKEHGLSEIRQRLSAQ